MTSKTKFKVMVKEILTSIGGPFWRLIQGTKHSTIGAIVVIFSMGVVLWVLT
jgi:hypothetical protein